MNTVISTAYEMFNRKLFSLPKVLLLPGVMSRQPLLIAQVFPFIFLSDWLKASVVSYMTTNIESLQKEIQEISAIRSKVESFDIKNAELLQRSGKHATQFTQRRWESLTIQVQGRQIISDLLGRGKGFFAFMQRNFIFTVLIDCALANLIAIGKIAPSEIFVYSRAIEDAVDMLLMRSRGEAELARMMTEIEKLDKLNALWASSKKPNLLRCLIDDGRHSLLSGSKHNRLILRNLHYSRGTAMARADHIELGSGVYALTGANGSGKSTLFRILMSCHTNEKSIELPSSINMLTPSEPLTEDDDLRRETACLAALDEDEEPESCENGTDDDRRELHHIPRLSITMPSHNIVEISQNFYWPLYAKPIDWIFQGIRSKGGNDTENQSRIRKVAEELHSLQFFQSDHGEEECVLNSTAMAVAMDGTTESLEEPGVTSAESFIIDRIISELQEDRDDWFGDLSGGQKSKVELVRTVFLKERCPDVLLIDETMAPLDPASKVVVMSKLKSFCRDSIVIVIYHTDVGQGKEVEGKRVDCVPSNEFFTMNIHLEKGIVHLRDTC
jgi:energy-coupling factor transporter ATP-binding protein EcfA2